MVPSAGWSIRQKLAGVWKQAHAWQRHSGPTFFPSFSSRAFSVSSPALPIPPSLPFVSLSRVFLPSLSSSLHSSLPLPFLPLSLIIVHSFTFHSYVLFLLFPPPFSSPLLSLSLSLSAMTWGPGLLCTGPSHSFSLNLTISHMSIRRQPPPSLAWACRDAQIKHHLLHSARRRASILLLWGGRAQRVPGGAVACLDNLIY